MASRAAPDSARPPCVKAPTIAARRILRDMRLSILARYSSVPDMPTAVSDFVEPREDFSSSPLWNPDLAPTPLARRTWSTYHIAALWIGMSVVITTYTLASGLMQQGMTWWQAMLTILLGNTIVLIPMILNAHAGTKYGVSFPVLCRASFGVTRRECAGDLTGARRMRVVRHSNLDWRACPEHVECRRVAAMEHFRSGRMDFLRGLLARAGLDHSQWS